MNTSTTLHTLTASKAPASVFFYPETEQTPEYYASAFIRYVGGSEATAKTYGKALRRFFSWMQAHGISNPSKADLREYRQSLADNLKPTSGASYLNAIKQFYKFLESEGIALDIARTLKPIRIVKEYRKDPLTLEQAQDLLENLRQDRSIEGLRNYALIYLCLSAGLRTIETTRANIGDLHTLGGYVVLDVQGKGHKDKDQLIKVSRQAEKAIREYLQARGETEEGAPLFASHSDRNPGGRMHTESVSRIIKGAFRSSGLDSKRITAHSLRHTTATLNLLNGGSLQETQQLLRHANINTTMIYNHALDRMNNQSEQRLSNLLGGAE